jgi:hypothetical protein
MSKWKMQVHFLGQVQNLFFVRLSLYECTQQATVPFYAKRNCSYVCEQTVTHPGIHTHRRKIRLIEVNAKCRHLKNWPAKDFAAGVTRVYRLEISNFCSTFRHVGIFNPAFWSVHVLSPVAPLPPLWFNPPPPCANKYLYNVYAYTVCKGGGGMGFCWRPYSARVARVLHSEHTKLVDHPKQKPRRGGGLRQINTCSKIPLQVHFFRWRHFALPSMSLIFLRHTPIRILELKSRLLLCKTRQTKPDYQCQGRANYPPERGGGGRGRGEGGGGGKGCDCII